MGSLLSYVALSFLECVSESDVQIDGIHGKGDCVEIFLEDIVQSPSQCAVHVQVLEGTPFAAQLQSPLEVAQFVGEVVGGYVPVVELYFAAALVRSTQVPFVNIAGKVAFKQVGYVGTKRKGPTIGNLVVGYDWERQQ